MNVRASLACSCLLLGAAACNVGKTASQAAARHVMVATLIATPEFTLRPEAIAGLDASFPSFDAGTLPDGGVPTFDAGFPFDAGFLRDGGLVIPAQTLAFAFFGERQGDGLTDPPVGLAGATMKIETGSGASFELKSETNGTFSKSSLDDASFQYEAGQRYTFIATAGEAYVAEVPKVPAPERVRRFHPDEGYLNVVAGSDLIVTRADPPENEDRDLGFITVVPISRDGQRGAPTYTNVPTDAIGLLQLVAAPSTFKRTEVLIPGSAFPDAEKNYVIVLQTARVGAPTSDNLFIGSAILAGTADVAVVKTRAAP